MNKITDYANMPLEIKLESPVFDGVREKVNSKIEECLKELDAGNFEAGEITVGLKIGLENAYECFPKKDENGENITDFYDYKRPVIKHAVSLTLKKQEKADGKFDERRELKRDGDVFLAVPVITPQVSIDEV